LFRARTRISSTGWISFKTVSFSASDIFYRFIFENETILSQLFVYVGNLETSIASHNLEHLEPWSWSLQEKKWRKKNQISQFRLFWFGRNKKTIGKKRNFLKNTRCCNMFFCI
jgi:hypothetical protein